MLVRFIGRVVGLAALACLAWTYSSQAQPQPQPRQQAPHAQQSQAQPQPRQQPQFQQQSQQQQAQQPPAAAVALAMQLLELKGGITVFDPAIEGVIRHHKGVLLQINPNPVKDVNEVEQLMRTETEARRQELHNEIARGYASAFSEQDLKDMIEFYKTPLGKKMIDREPKAGEESARRAQAWIEKYAEEVVAKMHAEMKRRGHTEF